MDPERIQFVQRHENEPAVMEARVRDRHSWFLDDAFTIEKYVEVDRSRTGTIILISSERSLNLLKDRKETLRRDIGFKLHHPVEEPPIPRIGYAPNRLRFIQEGNSLEP